jgi:hypothetical protein
MEPKYPVTLHDQVDDPTGEHIQDHQAARPPLGHMALTVSGYARPESQSAEQAGQDVEYGMENGDHIDVVPPPGFVFDADKAEMNDESYEAQVRAAVRAYEYQNAPVPSFEETPTVDVVPTFNPTGAPESEIYAHNRAPLKLSGHTALHSEFGHTEPVEMWRIIDRSRLIDGTGLVSSQILLHNTLGDIEHFKDMRHISTEHDDRMTVGSETPFVSFATDPAELAKLYILQQGFGVSDGRDSVVVRARVDPARVITNGQNKAPRVALVGGVAPNEFVAAYELSDFVKTLIPEDATITRIMGSESDLSRDEALGYWGLQ